MSILLPSSGCTLDSMRETNCTGLVWQVVWFHIIYTVHVIFAPAARRPGLKVWPSPVFICLISQSVLLGLKDSDSLGCYGSERPQYFTVAVRTSFSLYPTVFYRIIDHFPLGVSVLARGDGSTSEHEALKRGCTYILDAE